MPGRIPEAIKDQRVERLMLTQQRIAFAANERRVGGRLACLVDSIDSGGGGRARFYGQAPDIDSLCILPRCSAEPGEFIDTVVTGTNDYDLIVEQV
jgi:ribosomal protein S12 methylthiotransferase